MTQPAYLIGFQSLKKEFSADNISVKGKIPEWLNGELVRTGPAKFEAGKKKMNHWFDGHALLHKFTISAGKVNFHSKFLLSQSYIGAQKKQTLVRPEYGTDPCYSIFGRIMSFFDNVRTDNCNVNVAVLQNKTVALTESTNSLSFDPESLDTTGQIKYKDKLDGQMTTAHPHYDYKRKLTYNYLLKFGYKSKYQFYSLADGAEGRKLIAEVEAKKPSYIHSFGMTENYLILAMFPLTVMPLKLKFRMKPLPENYKWEPEQKLKFAVVHKDTGEIVKYGETDSYFGFHHINAYEEGSNIICDICVLDDASIINSLYLERLKEGDLPQAAGEVRRFIIPLDKDKEITHKVAIKDTDFELPRINYKNYNGKKYQYAYGCGVKRKGDFIDSIVKINLAEGSHKRWFRENHYPGEPVFVSAPDAKKEDEGVVLSIVLDSEKQKSYLLVLDAENFTQLATAELEEHIPFGFHGQFFGK